MGFLVTVSIIIPTFNRVKLLEETLFSLKDQTFKDWECIIIDDGSIDETEHLVKEISVIDGRFKYLKRPEAYPRGAAACRNFGVDHSKGKFIQWLDDDDLISTNKLEVQVELLTKMNNDLYFCTCPWDEYWPGKKISKKNVLGRSQIEPKYLLDFLHKKETFLPCHSFLMPKSLVIKVGGWNNGLSINDDAEFLTRIAVKSEKLLSTPDCYVLYRMHNGSRISSRIDSANLSSLIYSFKLMHAHLKLHSVNSKKYFRWKLKKIFLNFWDSDREVILENKYFFAENGIYLKLARIYFLKWNLYKTLLPFYKRLRAK